MFPRSAEPAAMSALSTLDDPLRRELYQLVADTDGPVSREDAAAAAGIGRTLAAYHLDKLADADLLAVTYQRPDGRGGPGAGRPAKLYSLTDRELVVSVPPRDYRLLAGILVTSIEQDTDGTVRAVVDQVARDAGAEAAHGADGDLIAALRDCGYLPHPDSDGGISLRNCPFHAVAKDHLDVVCGLNLELIRGAIAGSSSKDAQAELNPRPGHCCVQVRNANAAQP
ncbi:MULTISPECIES: metalloregulator ArsR/SmtB family transcription factor [unclassified Mycolicibacterium]|uniref:helix-turn-helix transcriptional regulator n=1 Tax=unclassified Mycolicibacterium TaxID=2636767 RepID=UPI0012DF1D1B|nr:MULTISPECIES: helix-turn-helix domain-containing protein [unclassified Mycolicibacterium]MUL85793.1 helix-turn-helix domain-containing protein [Mycolicibacterium sp. CBMA 329]MUL90163.1 helix-turn-helix domain-containing protein [Mycolicibacterium sp. CBMA 331]MUM00932.1 helix-turn-helix domain-containing protein [Mycolicibacterium sp. CBMA 334]MUM27472.1 helix-turn-helix domain-containing protein [Mycolicibacterium sp. CBMA 295]MUM39678.1 helix-turn-helix domain-containing protein [Mycolic